MGWNGSKRQRRTNLSVRLASIHHYRVVTPFRIKTWKKILDVFSCLLIPKWFINCKKSWGQKGELKFKLNNYILMCVPVLIAVCSPFIVSLSLSSSSSPVIISNSVAILLCYSCINLAFGTEELNQVMIKIELEGPTGTAWPPTGVF